MLQFAIAGLFVAGSATASVKGPVPLPLPPIPKCLAPFDKLLAADVFARYPTKTPAYKGTPVPPDVRTGEAHTYRTVIRDEAKAGPNFAGHFTIVRIGCGAATNCIAIVNAKTGQVHFSPKLKAATALLMDTGKARLATLNYTLDSRLLILAGEPNEDEKRAGMSYYLWDSGKLSLIHFVPAATLCERAR